MYTGERAITSIIEDKIKNRTIFKILSKEYKRKYRKDLAEIKPITFGEKKFLLSIIERMNVTN
jgi:hypothetical protein